MSKMLRGALCAISAVACVDSSRIADGSSSMGARLGSSVAFSTQPICGEAQCLTVLNATASYYSEPNCEGAEWGGNRNTWDGQGITGAASRTVSVRSYRENSLVCFNATATQTRYNVYRLSPTPPCGERHCVSPSQYVSGWFDGAGCTGGEWDPSTVGVGYNPLTYDGQGVVGIVSRPGYLRSNRGNNPSSCVDWTPYWSNNRQRVYRVNTLQPLTVAIDGYGIVGKPQVCTWTAVVNGGLAPYYFFYWTGLAINSQDGASVTGRMLQSGTIRVVVTDNLSQTAEATLYVEAIAGHPGCS
jgi:hypothetical protein